MRNTRLPSHLACLMAFFFLAGFLGSSLPGLTAELLPPGFRPAPLGVHALVGGKVVIKPGEVLENGTIEIHDGLIKAVGKDAAPPADARLRARAGSRCRG